MARKFITYFDEEGNDYTDELIIAVKDKLEASDNIKRILIASSSGESALKLYGAVGDDVEIINVTHHMGFSGPNEPDITAEMVEKLEKVGINNSNIHIDFMIGTSDLEITANTEIGKQLIFKKGNFNI